jgi:hypothetical protein
LTPSRELSQTLKVGPDPASSEGEPVPGWSAAVGIRPTDEMSPERVADAVEGVAPKETTDPIVESATTRLVRLVDSLISPYLDRIADVAGGVIRVVGWLLGGGSDLPTPVKDPHIPPAIPVPGIPPPTLPISSGGSPFGGSSASNGLTSFAGSSGSSVEKYGAWTILSTPLLQGGKPFWPFRYLLRPNSAEQSPIERPG